MVFKIFLVLNQIGGSDHIQEIEQAGVCTLKYPIALDLPLTDLLFLMLLLFALFACILAGRERIWFTYSWRCGHVFSKVAAGECCCSVSDLYHILKYWHCVARSCLQWLELSLSCVPGSDFSFFLVLVWT